MQQELMAFWSYDQFPFVLWGEVDGFTDEGLVKAKNYGTMLFKPLYIVPKDVGLLLVEDIDKLKRSYADSLSRVKSDHKQKLNNLLPFKWR